MPSDHTADPMTAAVVTPWAGDAGGFTTADLHALPDDGKRWELIDGSLILSPSATYDHNILARWIAQILEDSCPDQNWIVGTDQSATIDRFNEPRPDIIVAPAGYRHQSPAPIARTQLVAEVVSPSSVLRDTEEKRALYARAGIPAYWIIVANMHDPAIRLAELVLDESAGQYRFATQYTDGVFETEIPWPVRIDLPALSAKRAGGILRSAE